jgi:predicted alpha/beta hydrolase family esterase
MQAIEDLPCHYSFSASCLGGLCLQNDAPVLILPGLGNSGPQHWQTLWELRHPQWQRVNLGDWDGPVCEDWVRALDVAVQACSSPPVLVAHSLACLLVAHWAHRSALVPKGAFLVAVPDPRSASFPATARGFVPVPMAAFAFRSLVVASANDPLGSRAHAKHCAIAWGSTFVDIGQAGHINADSGHGEWSEGYMLLQRFMV